MACADARWWARLVPCSDDAASARAVDRASASSDGSARAGELALRLKSTVIGRVVMNRDGTARAKAQPADIALEVPSGACVERGNARVGWVMGDGSADAREARVLKSRRARERRRGGGGLTRGSWFVTQ